MRIDKIIKKFIKIVNFWKEIQYGPINNRISGRASESKCIFDHE